MLVNMSLRTNRQLNMSINNIYGTFASFNGRKASSGMFASKISYGSPTSVSVIEP